MKITRRQLKSIIKEELSKRTSIKEASYRKNVTAMGVDFEVIDQDGDLFWKFKDKKKGVERVNALGGVTNFAKKIQASLDYSYGKGHFVLRSGKPVEQTGGLLFMKNKETDLSKLKIESKTIKEASEVEFKKLPPAKQNQITKIAKIVGGKHSKIFDGIHGSIVYISLPSSPMSYRFDSDTMKELLSAKVRWVQADKGGIAVGF